MARSRLKTAATTDNRETDDVFDQQIAARAEEMQNRPELPVKTGEIIQSVADAYQMPPTTASGGPGTVRATGGHAAAIERKKYTPPVDPFGFENIAGSQKNRAFLLKSDGEGAWVIRFAHNPNDDQGLNGETYSKAKPHPVLKMLKDEGFRWGFDGGDGKGGWGKPFTGDAYGQDHIEARRVLQLAAEMIGAPKVEQGRGALTNEAVELAIIKPMVTSLPAPLHVRSKPAAIETLLNVYRHALAGFERETLEKAWLKVASEQDFWLWPMPETLVKAARHFHDLAHPFDQRQTDAWVEKAQALTDAYVKRFMLITQTAVRAREGGYEVALKEYVEAASWVQAQMIVGRHNVGYSACVLSGPKADGEEKVEFFEKARAQAKTGHIKVSVPKELVAQWSKTHSAPSQER